MKLKIGLVGLGNAWETRYRPALRALSDRFDVRAVCDEVLHRSQLAAGEFNANVIGGFRALTCRDDIDAVLVLAPQWYGALPLLAACNAGKAIYCGAGLDTDLQTAQRIKQRVEESGVAFMAEFPRRQAPATLRLKELIATHLGQPRLLFCHQRLPCPANSGKAAALTIGQKRPTSDSLVELVDWCCYVVGSNPTSVIGTQHAAADAMAGEDYRMMSLDFSASGELGNGPVAQISSGKYVPADWQEAVSFRPPAALQVACERGIAFIDLPSTLIWFDRAGRHMESLESERPAGELLLSQFHRAVTSLMRNPAGLEEAFRAMNIVHSARQSHREGRRINL